MHWRNLVSNIIYIKPPKDRLNKNQSHSFCINLQALNFPCSFIRYKGEKFVLQASLFDFGYHQFFGKQWTSSPVSNSRRSGDIELLESDQRFYFHTSILDESINVVFEIIRLLPDQKQESVGWCKFNLLSSMESAVDLSSDEDAKTIVLDVYNGTPRALFSLSEPIEKNPNLTKIDKMSIKFNYFTHNEFDSCQWLIPENFLIHEDDDIPGLEKEDDGLIHFESPKISEIKKYTIEKLKVTVEPSLLDFENELLKDIIAERSNDSGTPAMKDNLSLQIVERRLRVCVSNGYKYTEENDIIRLNATDQNARKQAGNKRDENAMTAKNIIEVGLPDHACFAVIFIFEYLISETTAVDPAKKQQQQPGTTSSYQQSYQIRWAVYEPFSQKISPETLKNGVRLDLELNGGAFDAPENCLVYQPKSLEKKLNPDDPNAASELRDVKMKLSAVFREKKVDDKEPLTSVTNITETSTNKDRMKSPELPTVTEEVKVVNRRTTAAAVTRTEPQDILQPESKSTKPKDVSASAVDTQDAQMRLFQQFLMQQQMQRPQAPTFMSGMFSMPPTLIGQPYQNNNSQLLNLWQAMQIGSSNDKVADYDAIEAYSVGQDNIPYPSVGTMGQKMQPLQMRAHSGLGLSRALYSKLYAAGFPQILDSNHESPFVIEPDQERDVSINFQLEEKDPRQCNEIIFQFMAVSRFDLTQNIAGPRSVFFTFQFYRFPSISTERLILDSIVDDVSNYNSNSPFILRKTDKAGAVTNDPPGSMIRYVLDPSFMKPGEMFTFLEFLSQQTMHIDVWDGDSLLHIGSCEVPLKNLIRQCKISVQVSYELDIINQIEVEEEGGSGLKGRLHLRLANLGSLVSTRVAQMTLKAHPKKGALVDTTKMDNTAVNSISTSRFGGSMKDIYKTGDFSDGNVSMSGMTVRPQPAASKSRELADLLDKRATINGPVKSSPRKGNSDASQSGDSEKMKKLERLKLLLKTLPNSFDADEGNKLILEAKRSDKNEKLRNLQTIQCYREQQKSESIRNMLHDATQKDIVLYPKFGATELFEVKVKNNFNADHNVTIDMNQPYNYLSPVLNPHELRALKTLYSVTTASEDGLINYDKKTSSYNIFIRSKESVLIPFKFVNLHFQNSQTPQIPQQSATTSAVKSSNKLPPLEISMQISFRTDDSKLLSSVLVTVVPQPPTIDQTFRFFHPEQSFLKRLIRLPPIQVISGPNDSIKTFTRSSDPEILSECKPVPVGTPHDVYLKVPCGPAPQIRQFLLAVYVDKFLLQPVQVWHFTVHSQYRIDVVAHQGQTTNLILLVKGSSTSHRVKVFSSHPDELSAGQIQNDCFTLAAHNTYELGLSLTPAKIGTRTFQVNVVDVDNHTLVRSWTICAICKEPDVTKMFEIELPIGGGDSHRKRISFQNSYSQTKRFFISTDRSDLIMFKDNVLKIGAGTEEYIGIIFLPMLNRGKQKVYVFINDEDGKNEETVALTISYV